MMLYTVHVVHRAMKKVPLNLYNFNQSIIQYNKINAIEIYKIAFQLRIGPPVLKVILLRNLTLESDCILA